MTARKGREETHIVYDSAGYGGEAALRAEVELLRRQKAFANGIFSEIGLGLWSFELDEGKPPRMYGNPTMDDLVGCNGAEITPEEYYLAWYTRVDKAHLHAVQNVVERIIAGELAEVRYPYHHPDRGIVQVVDRNHRDGTGLGLPICERLVQLMGGELRIESEVGKGSTFSVVMPNVACADGESPAVSGSARTAVESPVTVRRVLVVDDSPVNLLVIKAMLKRCGVTDVVTAGNGIKALAVLKGDPSFDVVLTDLWMPEMDGAGLVRAIRKTSALSHLPVYLVTADVESVASWKEMGFTGALRKPITQAGVRELLTRELAGAVPRADS